MARRSELSRPGVQGGRAFCGDFWYAWRTCRRPMLRQCGHGVKGLSDGARMAIGFHMRRIIRVRSQRTASNAAAVSPAISAAVATAADARAAESGTAQTETAQTGTGQTITSTSTASAPHVTVWEGPQGYPRVRPRQAIEQKTRDEGRL